MSCALCVLTVGGGLLITRRLGISDMVFAIWLSGLNTSVAFFIGKRWRFLLATLFYLLTYLYFWKTGQMTKDVFVGMTVGLEVFVVAYFIDRKWRLFPFQKVFIPLFLLVVATLLAAAH